MIKKKHLSKSLIGASLLILVLSIKFSFSLFVSTVEDKHEAAKFCMLSGMTAFPSPYLIRMYLVGGWVECVGLIVKQKNDLLVIRY